MRALGCKPDKPDARDLSFDKLGLSAAVPDSADLTWQVKSILNQGAIGSCVANAGMQAVRMSHVRQGWTNAELGSRLFAYYLCRAAESLEDVDSGTQIRLFFWALNKFGFCREHEYAYGYDTRQFAKHPPPLAYLRGFDQRAPTKYYRIFDTGYARVDAVKAAIAAGHAVVFGTNVSVDFASQNANDTLWFPPLNEPIAGGHALTAVRFDGDVFGIAGSWGTGVGVDGYHRFSADYIAWQGTRDPWIVDAAPPYSS